MTCVRELFRLDSVKGRFGIEIELEGKGFPTPDDIPESIMATQDGSLRGESVEYVFRSPKDLNETEVLLRSLWDRFKKSSTDISISRRTGTHVHINVQEWTLGQVFSFVILYGILEDLLITFCGAYRRGNKFCLQITDAQGFITNCSDALKRRDLRGFYGSGLRYCSINVNALSKYGSLEFRAFRGTKNLSAILKWINILNYLADRAKQFNRPTEVLALVSELGAKGFAEQMLGKFYPSLVEDKVGWEEEVVRRVWLIQDLAYDVDWSNY